MKLWILVLFSTSTLVLGIKQLCPGGKATCSDSSTCCELLDKSYGCCPVANAVCCDDHIHCCPPNTKCSVGMCVQNTNVSTSGHLLLKNDVICSDSVYKCPEDTTCCKKTDSSEYGCCPMKDAVCCNDGSHCCPFGTTCDLTEQRCIGDGFQTQMYDSHKRIVQQFTSDAKLSVIQSNSNKVFNVICPGSEYQCPDTYTCCRQPSGDWGCCPFPKASCCIDGLHCCPEHMHCDATSHYCSQELRNITALRNKPAERVVVSNNICPDKSSCSSGETCCKVSETQFGCCHYANATCCEDFLHCCPSGNVCDVEKRQCVPNGNWMLNVI